MVMEIFKFLHVSASPNIHVPLYIGLNPSLDLTTQPNPGISQRGPEPPAQNAEAEVTHR